MEVRTDVAIVGAGFGGSITALLARQIGLEPVLIERGTHPRFAIGESSTPLADLALKQLCERYDLPRLLPLTQYGSWRREHPEIMRGLKRGFSYFHHRNGEPFVPSPEHHNEMLVEANPDDEHSDTQWFRADVDHFFAREAVAAGIPYFDRADLTVEDRNPWRLRGQRGGRDLSIEASFLIDASGAGQFLSSALGLGSGATGFRTNSRTIYSHFTGVRRWREMIAERGGRLDDHPFDCDAAALHHVFDGGWMWVLRFDNDVVSAGFVVDMDRHPLDESVDPALEWTTLLTQFPSISEQFCDARMLRPVVRTRRLQRGVSRLVGDDWAMLPHSAAFLDPLHSSGIAITLSGVERIIAALESSERDRRLGEYEAGLRREVDMMDKIIHGCYSAFADFDLMTTFSMYYFAGAIASEHRRRDGTHRMEDGFLMAHDDDFRAAVDDGYNTARNILASKPVKPADVRKLEQKITLAIDPFNHAGLCDQEKHKMYPWA
ncbi:MAG: NAD(P)/FAD-dependent oxidoreductase [Gemmatimonadales bacterium]